MKDLKFCEMAQMGDKWKMCRVERFEMLSIGKDRYLDSIYNDIAVRRIEDNIRFNLKLA
jgi:hypothetical protein